MLTDDQGDTIMFDINLDNNRNNQYNNLHNNEMNSDMRDLILFAARPDACPNDLAGRQVIAPKPQAGDYVLAPAVSVLDFPLSPSAHTAGGDKRSGGRYTGNATNDTNDQYNDHSEQEDYDRSTIMGSFNNSGMGDTCDLVAANLSAYQDGELDSDETRLVATHVGKCPRCAEIFETLQQTDEEIEREWRESAPLPSSLRYEQAVDSVMAALPAAPVHAPAFAPRRVYARARWTRFASGIAAVTVLAVSLWSSYQLGYTRGRSSVANASLSVQPQSLSSQVGQFLSPIRKTVVFQPSRLLLTPAVLHFAPTILTLHPTPRITSASALSSFSTLPASPASYTSVLPRSPLRHSQPHP